MDRQYFIGQFLYGLLPKFKWCINGISAAEHGVRRLIYLIYARFALKMIGRVSLGTI